MYVYIGYVVHSYTHNHIYMHPTPIHIYTITKQTHTNLHTTEMQTINLSYLYELFIAYETFEMTLIILYKKNK